MEELDDISGLKSEQERVRCCLSVHPFCPFFLVDISESIHTTTGLVLLGPNPRQLEAWAMFHLDIPATTLVTPTTTSICKLGPFWPVSST